MRSPKRSPALARALATRGDELPGDFAARVAMLARAASKVRRSRWSDVALFIGFIAMIGVCAAGWLAFGPPEFPDAEWVAAPLAAIASQPWLVLGVAGVAIVRALTFRRRAAV
jgi:hypothetical protein